MKIYTRTGDAGQTGLLGGLRLPKDAPRIEAYGAVDELNAALGVARAAGLPPPIDAELARIQNELFDVGAELAAGPSSARPLVRTEARHVAALEQAIDAHEAGLPPLREFILPGGSPAAAQLHSARTVCRRAERRLVTLAATADEHVSGALVAYLNRLSDLLFVLARAVNAAQGVADVPWHKRS